MSMSMDVARCSDLCRRDFAREYLTPSPRPVILTDALSSCKALGKWTPDYFGEHYGHVEVTIDGRTMSIRALADAIRVSSPERPAPYLRNSLLSRWPKALQDDVTPLPRCTEGNWLDSRLFPSRESLKYFELYIGGQGASFPVLHFDGLHTHAFIMEIYGEKEFWVYPPDQTAFLYPRPGAGSGKSQIDDVEHPDLERFPLFAQARGTRFRLKAGETLFVPAGWWHTTRLLTPAISVSVNSADAANWGAFKRDFCSDVARERGRLPAALTNAYLAAFGGLHVGLAFLQLVD
jgi:histone arginine demethylase JMJD6